MTESNQEKTPAKGFCYDQLTEYYDWPVVVKLPQGGEYAEFEFTATFRLMCKADVEAFFEELLAAMKAEAKGKKGRKEQVRVPDQQELNRALLAHVWVGWDDALTGPGGEPMECTPENLEKWLSWKPMLNAIDAAYAASAGGQKVVAEN